MRRAVHRSLIAAAAVALSLACSPGLAQEQKTVAGLVINFGITPAEMALRADGHRDAHPLHPPSGSQHLLITLDDEKSHKRIGDAEVEVEVKDPRGHVERKTLLHTQAGGLPDYSDLFVFAWSGRYNVRVIVTPRPGVKPVETQFTVNHQI
jgi:hypothetical protein